MQTAIGKQRAAMASTWASAARQKEAVTRQSGASAPHAMLPDGSLLPAALTDPPCAPVAPSTVDPIIERVARTEDLGADLIRAVIAQESSFRPCAVSPKGARGLMQLMPTTIEQFQVRDPFDPAENIQAGARLLRQLLTSYEGDLARALGAYNAGHANVPRWGALPDLPETRAYVRNILERMGIIE